MALSLEVRDYQGAQIRRVIVIRNWTAAMVAKRFGRSVAITEGLLYGWTVASCYDAARLGHVFDLSDKQLRRIVEGAALRDWHANDRGRPHPFTRSDP